MKPFAGGASFVLYLLPLLSRLHSRHDVTAFQTMSTFSSFSSFDVVRESQKRRSEVHANHRHQPSSFSSAERRPVQSPSSSSAMNLMFLSDAASSAGTANAGNLALFKNADVWVFLVGIFPFAWAAVEFWRRIMFGEPFGTGRDSVIIGMDDAPSDSRGRRVLGRGALITAYVLFVIAFGTVGIVLYSVASSTPLGPDDLLPSSQINVAASSVVDVSAGSHFPPAAGSSFLLHPWSSP